MTRPSSSANLLEINERVEPGSKKIHVYADALRAKGLKTFPLITIRRASPSSSAYLDWATVFPVVNDAVCAGFVAARFILLQSAVLCGPSQFLHVYLARGQRTVKWPVLRQLKQSFSALTFSSLFSNVSHTLQVIESALRRRSCMAGIFSLAS